MKILYSNCSEIIGRLDGSKEGYKNLDLEVDTSTYPNDAVRQLVKLIKEEKITCLEDMNIENEGGGGNYEYVEECFDIAQKVIKKKIDMGTAELMERFAWENDEISFSKLKDIFIDGTDEEVLKKIKEYNDIFNEIEFDKLVKLLKIPKKRIPKLQELVLLHKI